MTPSVERMRRLPGAELVLPGLLDLRAGKETVESILVEIAAPRLRRLGVDVPVRHDQEPELRLHRILFDERRAGVHSRYNALIRRLVSFGRALELQVARDRRRKADHGNL